MIRALLALALLVGPAMADDALKGFAVYPGSRELCNQHVTGNKMHIAWSSHATRDALAKVVAHYEKALGKKAKVEDYGARRIEIDANRHVTIYPVTAQDKLPGCETKAKPGEKTIVMLSTAIR